MDIDFICTKVVTMKQKKKKIIIIMELILLHVNGHTSVIPGMACVPLGNHW